MQGDAIPSGVTDECLERFTFGFGVCEFKQGLILEPWLSGLGRPGVLGIFRFLGDFEFLLQ